MAKTFQWKGIQALESVELVIYEKKPSHLFIA